MLKDFVQKYSTLIFKKSFTSSSEEEFKVCIYSTSDSKQSIKFNFEFTVIWYILVTLFILKLTFIFKSAQITMCRTYE